MKPLLLLPLLAALALVRPVQHRPAAHPTPAAKPKPNPALGRGEAVYKSVCLTCHQADGLGVPNLNPPLVDTDYVRGDKARLVRIVLAGLHEPLEIAGNDYHQPMPAQAHLSDQQVADVLSFVRSKFGSHAGPVLPAEVAAVRAGLK